MSVKTENVSVSLFFCRLKPNIYSVGEDRIGPNVKNARDFLIPLTIVEIGETVFSQRREGRATFAACSSCTSALAHVATKEASQSRWDSLGTPIAGWPLAAHCSPIAGLWLAAHWSPAPIAGACWTNLSCPCSACWSSWRSLLLLPLLLPFALKTVGTPGLLR